MPFFQNVFASDYEGNWVLGDRQHMPKFVCPRNAGRGDEYVVSWVDGPYNLNINDASGTPRSNLVIHYALREPKNWAQISIDIKTGAASVTAVTPSEIVAKLMSNTIFASIFEATVTLADGPNRVKIRQKRPVTEMRFYVGNGAAEEALKFNYKAGIAELPTYFARDTIANRFTYTNSQNHLIELDTGNAVQAALITGAVDPAGVSKGFTASAQADYALLRGRSGLFQFQKGPGTVVASTNTTIVYPAGAKVGDLATKVVEQLDSGGKTVAKFELPYTLAGSDLITPP